MIYKTYWWHIRTKRIHFRLVSRLYNTQFDLDLKNRKLECQNQRWISLLGACKDSVKTYMYTHRFYLTGNCHVEVQFKSGYLLNVQIADENYVLWSIPVYLHPAKDHPIRVSNYNKQLYIFGINYRVRGHVNMVNWRRYKNWIKM